jgi:hypothetical protein
MSPIILRSRLHAQRVPLLLLLAHSVGWGQAVDCPPGCSPGRWSNRAVDLSSAPSRTPEETRDIRVVSPDGQKIARIVKDKWWVEIDGTKIPPGPKASRISYPAELAWAPNSRALYITEGAGYSTGYRTVVYGLENNKLSHSDRVNQIVQHDFERHHKCAEGQLPNVAGLLWMNDSKRLLVVAEVPPVSICPDMEYFGGYLISVGDGQIVERYGPSAMEDRWRDVLGDTLKSDFANLSAEQRAALP